MRFTNYSAFHGMLLSLGPEAAAERTAGLGFESVEPFTTFPDGQPIYSRIDAARLDAALRASGLKVACYSMYAVPIAASVAEFLDTMRRHLEFAARIGAPYLHHTTFPGRTYNGRTYTYPEALEAVLPYAVAVADAAKEVGIVCLYEPQGPFFNGAEGLAGLFAAVKRECANVGICGDVGNPLFADADPLDTFRALHDDILHIHVKDYKAGDAPFEGVREQKSLGGRYLTDCPLGEGIVPVEDCLRAVWDTGRRPRVALEIPGSAEVLVGAMHTLNEIEARYEATKG